MDGVGLMSYDIFLFGGARAFVLVNGAGSCLSRAVPSPVVGFGVSLGSACLWAVLPSGFGNVRHTYFPSIIKVALSAYLHCHQLPTCP